MAAALLTECSADYPTQRDLSVKLMSIYGAKLASSSDKLGSYQMLTFVLRLARQRIRYRRRGLPA